MARKREPVIPRAVGREFTRAEVQRLAELTAHPLHRDQGHPNPRLAELEAIHKAAGRIRHVTVWELGGGTHDPERALREELEMESRR